MKHALALALALVSGCAPYVEVETDWNPAYVERMVDYRTFGWLQADPAEEPVAEVPYDTIVEDRIIDAMTRHLTRRGYVPATGEQVPDFRVAWYYDTHDRVRVTDVGWYGGTDAWTPMPLSDRDTWISEWEEGVLIIDIVDTATSELVWRGVAASEVVDYDDPDERVRRIQRVVDEVLAGFPPVAVE